MATLCVSVGGCGEDADTYAPRVIDVVPGVDDTLPSDRPVQLFYDRYLDPSTVDRSLVDLISGELRASVWVEYDPVGPALLIHPFTALRPGLGYQLSVTGSRLRALGSDAPGVDIAFGFVTGGPAGDPPPPPDDEDIAALFAERCGACHGVDGAWPTLVPLDRQALVGEPARRQPERTLVLPGRPLDSYLVQRVLRDYPGVRGMEKALSDDERRAIVRWVRRL